MVSRKPDPKRVKSDDSPRQAPFSGPPGALNGPYWTPSGSERVDLLIIGAGAAGLWGARAAAARSRALGLSARIAIVDGRGKLGAKILMSGGTRCNLTHTEVHPEDYRGGNRHRIARVLRAHLAETSRRMFTD